MSTENTTTAIANRRTFTREMRVTLTEAEITERGRKLASRRGDRAQLDDKRKAVTKEYGGQLAVIDAELDSLQSAINTGSELRPIACYEEFKSGVVEIRRVDTDEVIDTRIPTLTEQQTSWLPDEPTPAGDGSDEGATAGGEDAGEGGPAGDGDDDFGGAVARVKSSTGGTVAHMPDDEGEAPDPGALGELAKPAKAAKKGRAPRKAK